MDGQLILDLGFLFCFSHHRKFMGMGEGKGWGCWAPSKTRVGENSAHSTQAGHNSCPLTSPFPCK